MEKINALRARIPDPAKDVRLNLSSVLQSTVLDERMTWAVALTSAIFLQDGDLQSAIRHDAGDRLTTDDCDDALAAAALMAMNTVLYRSRHMLGKESYHQRRASLRMNRMAAPATSKQQFELCAIACAALAGCEACLQSHESSILDSGLTEEHVHEVLRICAVIASASTALAAVSV